MFLLLELEDKRLLFKRAIGNGMQDRPMYEVRKEMAKSASRVKAQYWVTEHSKEDNLTANEVLEYLFKFKWSMVGL